MSRPVAVQNAADRAPRNVPDRSSKSSVQNAALKSDVAPTAPDETANAAKITWSPAAQALRKSPVAQAVAEARSAARAAGEKIGPAVRQAAHAANGGFHSAASNVPVSVPPPSTGSLETPGADPAEGVPVIENPPLPPVVVAPDAPVPAQREGVHILPIGAPRALVPGASPSSTEPTDSTDASARSGGVVDIRA